MGENITTPVLIQRLMERIEQLEAGHGKSASQESPQPSELKRPRPKLRDPEVYDGTKRSWYPQFRSKLRAKLRIDAPAIGSEYDRMWHAFGCLSGEAAANMLPWMDRYASDENKLKEGALESMLDQMDFYFLDRNLQERAVHELATIRQANRPFSTFLAEFNRLLMEAGGHEWSDDVKKSYIDRALNREMKDRLVTVEKKDDFEGYCQQLQRYADRMEENQQTRVPRSPFYRTPRQDTTKVPSPMPVPTAPPAPAGDPMDWQPSPATSRTQRRAKWVDEAERQRRRDEGLCLRCGASGHMIRICPHAPAVLPTRTRAIRVSEPVLEDEDPADDQDQGKDNAQ
jgi:hypothetical protein